MGTLIKALLAITALSLSSIAQAQATEAMSAHKDAQLSVSELNDAIAYIERTIKLPKGSDPLEAYGRYYAQHQGRVYAVFMMPWAEYTPGIHILSSYDQLPGVLDGGCGVIDVVYTPSTRKIRAKCHGHG